MLEDAPSSDPGPGDGPHIVAVDDSETALEIIRATVAEFGYDTVTGFQDPLEALEAIASAAVAPDLILLDVMMPTMNGVELCARLRTSAPVEDVPIIMLTSRHDMPTLSKAFVAGANDYVTKPFEAIELEARIRSCLRLRSELRRRRASEALLADPQADIPRSRGATSTALLASQSDVEAALRAVPPERWDEVGLVVMILGRHAGSKVRGPLVIPEAALPILSRVETPSNSLFAPFGDGIYGCLTMGLDESALDALARRFATAMTTAALRDPDDPSARTLVLSTSIARFGRGQSLAATVGDAIRAAGTARKL